MSPGAGTAAPGNPPYREVALIDEARCIGCTLCIQACPYEAIAGAAQLMHTVLARACTGCGLCLPPCPVDCISMAPTPLALAPPAPASKPAAAAGGTLDPRTVARAMENARERLARRR